MLINEVLDRLPRHLMDLVIDQPYNDYTAQDQALWRFVMRQNIRYLSKVAHGTYLEGLERTGISINEIPHMYGMNRILKEIGWAAVAVDGFIPPAAFMEFQAYNVLVIAADIRPIDQIEYTPAPDIIHEAAGHAPIIANPDYADYLKEFGKLGAKAFSSAKDYKLYEAIRHLSIIKADPYTKIEEIKIAEQELRILENNMGELSEMALIRNLHWWTVEYGLIGNLENPKIYGAGLLSSIGESYSCLKDDVKKIPFSLEAKNYSFDITCRQPHLFVATGFDQLMNVLMEFKKTMAISLGGIDGVRKAIASENTATLVLSSGLQICGTFSDSIIENDKVIWIKTNSPTNLCFTDKEIQGHGINYHKHGFGSPVGRLKNSLKALEDYSENELMQAGFIIGNEITLEFESGFAVQGQLHAILQNNEKIQLLTFSDCTVQYQENILFEPHWGLFDMAVGEKVISAFSGPADPNAFGLSYMAPEEKTHKIKHSDKAKKLHQSYHEIRKIREYNIGFEKLEKIWLDLENNYSADWLLPMEILEILEKQKVMPDLKNKIREFLNRKQLNPEFENLIANGFAMLYD